jgi:HAD superfamily hydrolase (TIGR01662 family)
MIRAVIFDLGHTLWDIRPGDGVALTQAYDAMRQSLTHSLGRDDLPTGAAIRDAVRDALRAAGETYFMNNDRVDQPPSHTWVDHGCRSLGLCLDEPLLRELTPPLFATEIGNLVCADGTIEAIRALDARGYALGCITNTLADTAAIRAMLRRFEIEPLMRCVVVSADEGWRKPHPSLFEKALGELDVAPHEAVFVGDSPLHDIGGAKAVGMHAVLTQQYAARDYTAFDPPPDAIIHHLSELPSVIDELEERTSGVSG